MSSRKQSMLVGGLISSAGIFFSKFISLFYAIPFNDIMQTPMNIQFYGVSYQIYSYLLNISLAGFPFAVAALVAKYSSKNDYKTVLFIKKLSTSLMMLFGFGMMMIVILFSKPLAEILVPKGAEQMKTVLIIISFALFLVPVLSSMRGFYQGLKEMEIYSLSQVIEQIVRVAFLLGTSSILVYVLDFDRIWAVYMGVFSASFAAIFAYIHLKIYDKKKMETLQAQADLQEDKKIDRNQILKELIWIAVPYLLSSIIGYSDSIINTVFLKNGLTANGMSEAAIETISGAINYGTLKLMAIPMVLAPGFSAAILPHITSYLTEKDYKKARKSINECIESVLYLAIPISFALFAFASPLYTLLFTNDDLQTCVYVLEWYSIEAFLSTLAPVFASLVMAIGLRSTRIKISILVMIVKLIFTYPMIVMFGFEGIILSSTLFMIIYIGIDVWLLKKYMKIEWKYTLRKTLLMLVSMLGMVGVYIVMGMLGLNTYEAWLFAGMSGRIIGLIKMGIFGLISISLYFGISYYFGLPQNILHLDLKRILKKRG